MLNYEITRSAAQRGHQRRVIMAEIVLKYNYSRYRYQLASSRVLYVTTMNKIDLNRLKSRKMGRISEQKI